MTGRTALVTGATGLLGRQVTKAFESRGWSVKGTGYSRADGVSVLKVDLGNASDVEKVLDQIKYVMACVESVMAKVMPLVNC